MINDSNMLALLDQIVYDVRPYLSSINGWDSLIVNRRKPHTYRAFRFFDKVMLEDGLTFDNVRVCLHRFETCSADDAFIHPHPWPAACYILKGSYIMSVGRAKDILSGFDHCLTLELKEGSSYAMTEKLVSHSVQPLETCYSIMVNLPNWPAHIQAPTTKGKDLDKMSKDELLVHLNKFSRLI